MRLSYRFRAFLVLTVAFVVLAVGWSVLRYRARAPEREAWDALVERLRDQAAHIDSLAAVVDSLGVELEVERGRLGAAAERIGHWERRAVGGRLPTLQYRRYRREIDRHNEVVASHNRVLAELRSAWRVHSSLVDSQNALIDSANALQRRAAQEGFELPPAELR